jgi:glycosyltransferase involved in cell wall biosynthesis
MRAMVEKELAHGLDALITVSEQVKNGLEKRGFPSEKIVVVRNGISTERADAAAVADKRRELGIGENEFVVVSAGRLAPVKNYGLLIEAVAKLKNVKLLLAGDGEERIMLEQKIQTLGANAVLLGARGDLKEIFGFAKVFAVSSLSGGISVALLEAMAAGLPVVATSVGGNGEVVKDGETGLLVPSGDAGALAAAIEQLATDAALRLRMAEASSRRVSEHFNIDRTVASIEKIYNDAISRSRHAA